MKILGIDPGHTTGYCVLEINNKTPKIIRAKECKDPTLEELEDLFRECDIIVCEDFLVDPSKSRVGSFDRSPMLTIQVIGAVKLLARLNGKEVVLQQNNIKPVGYGLANLKYVKKKAGVHIQDSIAHAMYYAVKQKLCSPL